jgi:hypothetical protein
VNFGRLKKLRPIHWATLAPKNIAQMAKLRPIWSHWPWLTFHEIGALQDLPAESQDAEEHPLLGAELDHDPSRRPHYLPQLIHW